MFPPSQDDHRKDGDGDHKQEDDEEVDEFGRKKLPDREKKAKQQREWPPCFDTNGTSFVLDARSGLFYEQESDFFYNPQNKLYYGNKKAAYYRYNPDLKPPFEEVSKVADAAAEGERKEGSSELDPVLDNNSKAKPSISIKLKTKKLPKKKAKVMAPQDTSTVVASAEGTKSSNPLKRQHHADMNKWSERQEELKEEEPQPAVKKARQVSKTAKGEPICTLCKRKFPNMEKLLYHERVSKLHAENLKKAEASKKTTPKEAPGAPTNYVDRAKQRRNMYGPSDSTQAVAVMTAPSDQPVERRVDETTTQVVLPEETLGSSNVGNQMLQKLGWSSGQALGRKREGAHDGNDATQSNLKSDWERIESMANSQRK
mmetsp:Transcript_39628/g.82350  ORF Transcript_39628/g.82350 Transcript_39628/m.82350 type:complete len:371 (-) Transcript_39628:835-1947(-)